MSPSAQHALRHAAAAHPTACSSPPNSECYNVVSAAAYLQSPARHVQAMNMTGPYQNPHPAGRRKSALPAKTNMDLLFGLRIAAPVGAIVGDTHGDLTPVVKAFVCFLNWLPRSCVERALDPAYDLPASGAFNLPSKIKILGDYVDRGEHLTEQVDCRACGLT